MKLTKKFLLGGSALAAIGVISATVVACSSTGIGNLNPQDNLQINSSNNTNSVFNYAKNGHNGVNLSNLAATINLNEIQHMNNILNNQIPSGMKTWLQNQKILVVDGQVPNPKWPRISTNKPENEQKEIENIQNNFIIPTPQLYPMLYSSQNNSEYPGFGMQFAVPTSQTNIENMLSHYFGEIIAYKPGEDNAAPLFNWFKNSATIVLYVYPATSQWMTSDLAQKALSPLISQDITNPGSRIIPVSLAQGFDSLNSPIGLSYLFQSLINGLNYSQTPNGEWSSSATNGWSNSLGKIYTSTLPTNEQANVIAELNKITPYFSMELNPFNIQMEEDGYAKNASVNKILFPFMENDLQTLKPQSNTTRNGSANTLSAYFNDTSMLMSLGFTPALSTYIVDPGTGSTVNNGNGVVNPTYIENFYQNLVNTSKSLKAAKNGQITPILQTETGIWQHHVNPIPNNLLNENVGTVFADDWLMPQIAGLYNNGDPIINHIIYNTQGDYTINGESFFTQNNKAALFNSVNENNKNTNIGYFPSNLLNLQNFFNKYLVPNSTTGISNELGNAIMNNFRGFQWFANQINDIKANEFQIPKTSFDSENWSQNPTKTNSVENLKLEMTYYGWNLKSNLENTTSNSSQKMISNENFLNNKIENDENK